MHKKLFIKQYKSISQMQNNSQSRYTSFINLNIDKYIDKFAQAGFFFTQEDTILCISCNLELRNFLHIRQPIIFHALESPNCKFLLKQFSKTFIFNITQNYKKRLQRRNLYMQNLFNKLRK